MNNMCDIKRLFSANIAWFWTRKPRWMKIICWLIDSAIFCCSCCLCAGHWWKSCHWVVCRGWPRIHRPCVGRGIWKRDSPCGSFANRGCNSHSLPGDLGWTLYSVPLLCLPPCDIFSVIAFHVGILFVILTVSAKSASRWKFSEEIRVMVSKKLPSLTTVGNIFLLDRY